MERRNPTLNVGQVFVASVFFRQHDRQHTGDDGLSVWVLDIWLLIQVNLPIALNTQTLKFTWFPLSLNRAITDARGAIDALQNDQQG